MNDLEICLLCAKAMDYSVEHERMTTIKVGGGVTFEDFLWMNRGTDKAITYWPLTNRAQAMDLVDVLRLTLTPMTTHGATTYKSWGAEHLQHYASDANILRAICLCAAKIQQAKEKT